MDSLFSEYNTRQRSTMTRRIQAKKTTTRNRYSKEFKDEALAESLGVPTAATELGLHESQLYGWRVKSRLERDQSETERNQAVEIVRLKRKVADQAEELAILKKAAAYFAKSLK